MIKFAAIPIFEEHLGQYKISSTIHLNLNMVLWLEPSTMYDEDVTFIYLLGGERKAAIGNVGKVQELMESGSL